MPELWIPYGTVEALVTLQAENLGAVADSPPETASLDTERLADLIRGTASVFICDSAPGTIELLRGLAQHLTETPNLRLMSSAPKRIEGGAPDLKGKITTLPPPLRPGDGDEPLYAPELLEVMFPG